MSSIDRSPPPGGSATERMRVYRQARLTTERVKHAAEDQIERELKEVDDRTAGTDHRELAELRASSSDDGPSGSDR